ncbi:MAG: exosome complex RNA-binding protein Csl4 [Candidatus Helarchaeota archaeon]
MAIPKTGSLVLPGDKIGVIEMFMPGDGTYEENGIIYSNILGHLEINMKKRIVSVKRKKKDFPIPSPGQVVFAKVEQIRRNSAIVIMTNMDGIFYTSSFEGMVHISQTSKKYIEIMNDAFNEGDIIKAKVLQTDRIPYQLTTIGKKMGVILAFCRICGNTLELKGGKLVCRQCGNQEFRKYSIDYGKMNA